MFIWEHKKRVKTLDRFLGLVQTYTANLQDSSMLPDPIENEAARRAREELNLILRSSKDYVHLVGVPVTIHYSPPQLTGGLAGEVDVIGNFFVFPRLQLPWTVATDPVQQALGVYKLLETRAWIDTFNPLYWLYRIFQEMLRIPFLVLGSVGYDIQKAQESFVGRVFVLVGHAVGFAATFLTLFEKLGLLEWLKRTLGMPG